MKVVIIDDEKLAIDLLEHYLVDVKGVKLVASYQDPRAFMREMELLDFEVLFLDVQMPGIQGIELVKELKKKRPEIIVVFVTAYKDYAFDAYQVSGYDYIAKPISKKRLIQSINNIKKLLGQEEEKEDIYYIQTLNEFIISKDKEILALKYRTRKVKELLAYLIHRYPESTNRDRLLLDVWGDYTHSRNFSELHSTVYRLRLLGKEWFDRDIVEVVSGMYRLRLDIVRDIDEFEDILGSARVGEVALEKLFTIYKGEYLASDNYDWATKRRLEFHRQVTLLVHRFVERNIDKKPSGKEEVTMDKALNFLLEQDIYNESYVDLLIKYCRARDKFTLLEDAYEKFTKINHVDREDEVISIIEDKYKKALGRIK